MARVPSDSKHPAVVAERRALEGARDWLMCEGLGGAYAGTVEQVKHAMNNYHPLGWVGFKLSLFGR